MNRAFAIVLRQFYLMRGSFSRVMPIFFFAMDIILWGFISKYLNHIAAPGFNFTTAFLSAMLLWAFFIRVMHGISLTLFEDVWSRNFLNVFASPISITEYILGLVFSSIITSTVAFLFMWMLAAFCFGLSFLSFGLALFPFLFFLFLFGIAFGVVSCAVIFRFGPAAEWFIWPVPAFLSPFVGVFYPISMLPEWMQYVSRLLPPSYVFEGMRTILHGGEVSMNLLLMSGFLSILYVSVACWIFKRVYQYAARVGLIARYSAESVT